jgi:hypothetical protein
MTLGADRGVQAPDPECRRDWVPVERPKRRREPEHEDEPVHYGNAAEPGPAADDGRAGVEVPPDGLGVQSATGGDVDA